MWWILLLLAACTADVEKNTSETSFMVDVDSDFNITPPPDGVVSVNYTNDTEEGNSTGPPDNISESDELAVMSGNFVRFYISTIDGLKSVALSEGMKMNASGNEVEAVFVSSDNGIGKTVLRVNGELSKPIEEKEGKLIGGTYVFIMEILYR